MLKKIKIFKHKVQNKKKTLRICTIFKSIIKYKKKTCEVELIIK